MLEMELSEDYRDVKFKLEAAEAEVGKLRAEIAELRKQVMWWQEEKYQREDISITGAIYETYLYSHQRFDGSWEYAVVYEKNSRLELMYLFHDGMTVRDV